MTDPVSIAADYSLKPSELAATLAVLVEARQPAMIWGPPGCAKSMVAQQVASRALRTYVDVRALLLDRVDLMGIPWRDSAGRTRWAPPSFLPPTDDTGLWLINLEELPSAVPDGAGCALPARARPQVRGVRAARRRLPHRLRQPRERPRRGASHAHAVGVPIRAPGNPRRRRRLVRLGRGQRHSRPRSSSISRCVPTFSTTSTPQSKEKAFPCPRTWEFVSNILKRSRDLSPTALRALIRGTVGQGAAVEFCGFLEIWQDLPHPQTIIADPEGRAGCRTTPAP